MNRRINYKRRNRRRYKRSNYGKGTVYHRVLNLEKKMRKYMADVEVKFYLAGNATPGTDDPVNDVGQTYILNSPLQGTEPNNRIGARISCTSIQVKGHFHPQFGGTPTEVRMVIFWDRQANHGNPPLFATSDPDGLLDDTILTLAPVHAPFNMTAKTRFKVVYDKVYVLVNDGNTDATTTNAIVVDVRKRLGRKTQFSYDADTGGAADITTNALWLLVIGNIAGTGSTVPKFLFNSKLDFKDS